MKHLKHIITLCARIPKRVYGLVFLTAVIIFFALFLKSIDWERLANLHFNIGYLLASTVIAIIFRYWGVLVWRYILIDLGATGLPAFSVLAYTYAKAWMGRYIPGTVTWIAGKVYIASAHGISKSRLAISSILEGSMQAIAILIVSMLLLGFDSRLHVIPTSYKVTMVCSAFVLLLLLTPRIFNRLIGIAFYLIKKKDPGEELLINEKAVIRAFVLYAIGGFIIGVAEFFIARTVEPSISWHNLLFVIGAFNLAGAIGILAIGVPSGIGVRDAIVLVLLSTILPKETALAITVVSRLWSAVADVLFYGLAALIKQLIKPSRSA